MSAPGSSRDLAAPLLDAEEEEEIIPTPRESMEETTQHFIEDLQLEREQSLIIGGTTTTENNNNDATEDLKDDDEGGK